MPNPDSRVARRARERLRETVLARRDAEELNLSTNQPVAHHCRTCLPCGARPLIIAITIRTSEARRRRWNQQRRWWRRWGSARSHGRGWGEHTRTAFESKPDMVDAHPAVLAAERVSRAADATKKFSAEVGHFAQRHLGKVALQAAIKADEYRAKAKYRFLVMAATWRVDPSLVAAEAVCGGSGAASRARGRGRGQWARSSSAGRIRDAPRCCRRSELARCGCPLRPLHSRTERRW